MKKIAKIFLWFLIILVLLFGGLYFASQPLLKGILDEKLEDTRIGGLYKVQVKNAYFDLFNVGVSLKDVQLLPDSTSQAFLLSPQIAVLNIKRVSLSYLNLKELIQNEQLQVGKIKIIDPELNLHFLDRKPLPKETSTSPSQNNIPIEIAGLELRKLKTTLHLKNGATIKVQELNVEIDKPQIPPHLLPEITKAIQYENIEVEISHISIENPNSLYNIEIDDIEVENYLKSIVINKLKVEPKYNKKEFAKKHKYQTDRFVINLDKAEIENFDIKTLLEDQLISIEQVNLKGFNMEVYRDKDHPFNFQNFPKLPQSQIRNIKQKLEILSIDIEDAHIVYLEKVPDSNKAGRVDFANLNAHIDHFGNTDKWIKEKELKIDVQASIYNKVPLYTQMNFPLGSNTFYVSGQIKKSPMYVFNEIVTPNAGAEIENGQIDQMNFSFKANNTSSSGEIQFLYHGLEVDFLKEKETGEIKERKFLNFLVNSLILPKQNPNKKGEEYHGVIEFYRDKNKGLFNYLWKSVFSGIKDTFVKSHKDIQEYTIKKEEAKKTKKELRQQKREERKKRRREKNK